MAVCANCGKQIGFMRRMTAGGLCDECAREQKETRDAARTEYEQVLAEIGSGATDPTQVIDRLQVLAGRRQEAR